MLNTIFTAQQPSASASASASPSANAETRPHEAQQQLAPRLVPTIMPNMVRHTISDRQHAPTSCHLNEIHCQEPVNTIEDFPLLSTWLHSDIKNSPSSAKDKINIARKEFVNMFIENGGFEENGRLYYPHKLVIQGHFLDTLPPYLTLDEDLFIMNCSSISNLPIDLQIAGSLKIDNCENITEITANPQIEGYIHISNCANLQHITLNGNAYISDFLLVRDSAHLKSIECKGLQGPLIALRLHRLTQIDHTLFSTEKKTDASAESEHAIKKEKPRVYILNSKLTLDEIEEHLMNNNRLMITNALCMSHNTPETEYGISTSHFMTLEHAIDFWNEFADKHCDRTLLQSLTIDQQRVLATFLLHLTNTSDFNWNNHLDQFADRIFNFIQFLNQQPGLQDELITSIDHANQGCGDRAIQSLSQLEITMLIEDARQDKNPHHALYNLALRLIKLDIVHKTAFQLLGKGRAEDNTRNVVHLRKESAELLLRFETKLAKTLDLPVFNRSMLYQNLTALTVIPDAIFRQTASEANAAIADETVVKTFLNNWQPWQILQRQDCAKKVEWRLLQSVQVLKLADECCLISMSDLHKVKQPVTVHNEAGFFALKPLLKWWSEKGTHPISKKNFLLSDLRKVVDHLQINTQNKLRSNTETEGNRISPTEKRPADTNLKSPTEKKLANISLTNKTENSSRA